MPTKRPVLALVYDQGIETSSLNDNMFFHAALLPAITQSLNHSYSIIYENSTEFLNNVSFIVVMSIPGGVADLKVRKWISSLRTENELLYKKVRSAIVLPRPPKERVSNDISSYYDVVFVSNDYDRRMVGHLNMHGKCVVHYSYIDTRGYSSNGIWY